MEISGSGGVRITRKRNKEGRLERGHVQFVCGCLQ